MAAAAAAAAPSSSPASSSAFLRSESSDSGARMLPEEEEEEEEEKRMRARKGPPGRRKKKGSPPGSGAGCLALAGSLLALLALQVASAAALFLHFSKEIQQLKSQAQGTSEELRCLLLLNRLQDLSNWEGLVDDQSCLKLAGSIKDYVSMVMENVVHKGAQTGTPEKLTSDRPLMSQTLGSKPSAHLTLRRQTPVRPGALAHFGELQQSCQHPIPHWANQTLHAHLQNITFQEGKLHISQPGKYYVYAQIYFRYPTEEGTGARTFGHQLVQCINLQNSYGQNVLLLKGVGTKCWAKDATYGLHALYQGGLFDLRAGDKLFVSVSSLDINYGDAAGSYFGAFRLEG